MSGKIYRTEKKDNKEENEDKLEKRNFSIFYCSLFFVLGFSIVFSLLGVLLQTVLSKVAYDVQIWLSRIGGIMIILFGIYLIGLLDLPILSREYKFKIGNFKSRYFTSFLFGSAFAVGWTPCVGPLLGAIIVLAASNPSGAFALMLSYSLGLGIPFLLVGLFTNQANAFIKKSSKILKYLDYIFGMILIIIGILVFTNNLSNIANLGFVSQILISLNLGSSATLGNSFALNILIAFFAGLASFLSPCVLPIIPGFLAYLASAAIKEDEEKKTKKIKED